LSLEVLLVAAGWGAIVAVPFVRHAQRAEVASRLELDAPPSMLEASVDAPAPRWWHRSALGRWAGPVGRVLGGLVQRRVSARQDQDLMRDLPVAVDLLAVAVGAGCTPFLAVGVASQWAPPAASEQLDRVRRDCSLGVNFSDALERMARTRPPMQPLVDALLSSERYGAPVGVALTRLAVEERAKLRRQAEARARTVPVRLLFPLIFLVLPAFALLSVVPVLLAGLSGS
jgi:pilus assembly protein TadC